MRVVVCASLVALVGCRGPLVSDAGLPDGGAVTPDGGPPADLDEFMRYQMEVGHLPGMAVAVIREDEIVWIGTYGYANVATMTPVDAHTLFIVASISKTMALTRALQLVESNRLDLDAPSDSTTSFAIRNPDFERSAITTRMLLSHTSGIDDNVTALARATSSGDPTMTLDEFAEGYVTEGGQFYDPSNFATQAGKAYRYCNACFGIVGDLVELAGGETFREQTRVDIFMPLAMDGAGWFLGDVDQTRVAVPYGWGGRSYYAEGIQGFAFYPASSLRVSVIGLARFAQMWLRGGELDGVRVLSPETVSAALEIQYPRLDSGQALTFHQHHVGTHVYMGHSGSTFGGAAQLLFDPATHEGIVLITNSDAYIRNLLGQGGGADAMDAILERLDQETF